GRAGSASARLFSGPADEAACGGGHSRPETCFIYREPRRQAWLVERADVGQLDDVAEGVVDHGGPHGGAEVLTRPGLTAEADARRLECVHGLVEGVGRDVEGEVAGP